MIQHLVNLWMYGIEVLSLIMAAAQLSEVGRKGMHEVGVPIAIIVLALWPAVLLTWITMTLVEKPK